MGARAQPCAREAAGFLGGRRSACEKGWTKLSWSGSMGWAMRQINIHEAKTHLSRLVEQAAEGEVVVVAKAGKPIAKLTALSAVEPKAMRRTGFLRGAITTPDDFDSMGGDQILALFGVDGA